MANDKWCKSMTLKLISCVEKNEHLWRVSLKDYKNKIKRNNTLQEMATELGVTKQCVEKKIHNLRCQYRNEKRKEKQKKSGSGSSEVYKSKWEFYDLLNFMYNNEDEEETRVDSLDSSQHIEINNESTFSDDSLCVPSPIPSTSETPSIPKGKKRKSSYDTQEQAALNRCLDVMKQPTDEFQTFGDFVANELRGIQSNKLQKKLKRLIQRDILNVTEEDAEVADNLPQNNIAVLNADGIEIEINENDSFLI